MVRLSRAALALAVVTAASCAHGTGAARSTPPAGDVVVLPRVSPAAQREAYSGCEPERVRALIDSYVAAYNAGDFGALRRLFDVEHRFFEYYDSVQGTVTQVRGAQQSDEWEQYVRGRMASGERLGVTTIQHFDGYAGIRFTRAVRPAPAPALGGSAKIVCDGDRIIRVVMHS